MVLSDQPIIFANIIEFQNQLADLYVKYFITSWYWPYYVIGNLDDWQKLGITLNGIRPINICQPKPAKHPQITKPQINFKPTSA